MLSINAHFPRSFSLCSTITVIKFSVSQENAYMCTHACIMYIQCIHKLHIHCTHAYVHVHACTSTQVTEVYIVHIHVHVHVYVFEIDVHVHFSSGI